MPKMESEDLDPGHLVHSQKLWWDRGYDEPIGSPGIVCLRCGVMVSRGVRPGDQALYWQIHDRIHDAG